LTLCLPLPLVRPFINEKAQLGFRARPEVPFKTAKCQQVKAIEPNVAKVALPDMPHEHALTAIVGRWLSKFTRTGNITAADIKPVTGESRLWHSIHAVPPRDPYQSSIRYTVHPLNARLSVYSTVPHNE
jgi:hypothetical protein